MKKTIRVKTVILYSLIILLIIIAIDFCFDPAKLINFDFVFKKLDKIKTAQQISPQRLYVNVWRTTKNEYADASLNNQNWAKWRNKYLKQIKTMEDADIAINTMLTSLNDPYTKFLNSKESKKQKEMVDSKITGFGIILNNDGENITVNNVLDNSPAQENEILKGDTIISIDNKDAKQIMAGNGTIAENISKNDNIKIKIKRDNKIIEKEIKKSQIAIKTMDYKITKDNIGIITIASIMGEKAMSDFTRIIEKTNNTSAIIIDLRNNYGGVLSNAIEMANYMLDEQKIVTIESRGNNKLQIFADDEKIFRDKPIVILVNKYTASAAEILAGTLKDNYGAIIVGENTYGKNSIQQIIPLSNNTSLTITSNKYILPKGEDIHNVGIEPDIYISSEKLTINEAVNIANKMMKK